VGFFYSSELLDVEPSNPHTLSPLFAIAQRSTPYTIVMNLPRVTAREKSASWARARTRHAPCTRPPLHVTRKGRIAAPPGRTITELVLGGIPY
jgi:hypothetical protein